MTDRANINAKNFVWEQLISYDQLDQKERLNQQNGKEQVPHEFSKQSQKNYT